eukprot:7313516-Pyramimonas_sp.AAC.2
MLPIARGVAVYTPRENQSQEGWQYVLRVRTNRKRGGSIYSVRDPIARGVAVYTPCEIQSQEGWQYILRVRTNRRRGGSIYSA